MRLPHNMTDWILPMAVVAVVVVMVADQVLRNRWLFWKEWGEQRWRVIGFSAVGALAMVLSFHPRSQFASEAFFSLMLLASCVLPIFTCMSIGGENRTGTLRSLLARPVDKQQVFLAKTMVGALACVLPVLCVGAVALALASPHEIRTMHVYAVTGCAAGMALVTWLWMMAFATTARNESQAGMWALMVFAVWASVLLVCQLFVMAILSFVLQNPWETSDVPEALLLMHPLGIVPMAYFGKTTFLSWWHVPVAIYIWWSAARQYGELEVSSDVSLDIPPAPKARLLQPPKPDEVRPLAPTPAAALWWKEWRLSWGAVFGQCVMYLIFLILSALTGGRAGLEAMAALLFFITPMAAVMAAVGGIGWEMDRRLLDFVRSRPIDSGQWFAAKYVSGMTGALLVPAILVCGLVIGTMNQRYWYEVDPNVLLTVLGSWGLVYSGSMLVAVTVRNPVYSGVLAFSFAMLIYLVPGAINQHDLVRLREWVGDGLWHVDRKLEALLNAYWGFWLLLAQILLSLLLTFAARWAVRRDWHTQDEADGGEPRAMAAGV